MIDQQENRLISNLHTEQRNPKSIGITGLPVMDMLKIINEEDQTVALCVKDALPQIADAVTLLEKRMRSGGRMVYVGAGTSGRLGIMDAAECGPTYGVNNIHCIIAGGHDAVFKAQEVMEDHTDCAVDDLEAFGLTADDVVIAAAASGRTPYCIGALEYAKSLGAGRISISCNPDSTLSRYADVGIEVDTGAEVIMGSTRMKAASAQKMIMNMLSTTVMIRLDRTYDNLMVHIQARNQKADNRMLRLFLEAAESRDAEFAKHTLAQTKGDLALAVFMALSGCPLQKAEQVLQRHGGNIQAALTFYHKTKADVC